MDVPQPGRPNQARPPDESAGSPPGRARKKARFGGHTRHTQLQIHDDGPPAKRTKTTRGADAAATQLISDTLGEHLPGEVARKVCASVGDEEKRRTLLAGFQAHYKLGDENNGIDVANRDQEVVAAATAGAAGAHNGDPLVYLVFGCGPRAHALEFAKRILAASTGPVRVVCTDVLPYEAFSAADSTTLAHAGIEFYYGEAGSLDNLLEQEIVRKGSVHKAILLDSLGYSVAQLVRVLPGLLTALASQGSLWIYIDDSFACKQLVLAAIRRLTRHMTDVRATLLSSFSDCSGSAPLRYGGSLKVSIDRARPVEPSVLGSLPRLWVQLPAPAPDSSKSKGVIYNLLLVQPQGSDLTEVVVGLYTGQTTSDTPGVTPQDAVRERYPGASSMHTAHHRAAYARALADGIDFVETCAHSAEHPSDSQLSLTEAEQSGIDGSDETIVGLGHEGRKVGNLVRFLDNATAEAPAPVIADRLVVQLLREGIEPASVHVTVFKVNTAVACAPTAHRDVLCPCGERVSTSPFALLVHGHFCAGQGEGDPSCTAADIVAAIERYAGQCRTVDGELMRKLTEDGHLPPAAVAAAIVARYSQTRVKELPLAVLCGLLTAEQRTGLWDAYTVDWTAAAASGNGVPTLDAAVTDSMSREQLTSYGQAATQSAANGRGVPLNADVTGAMPVAELIKYGAAATKHGLTLNADVTGAMPVAELIKHVKAATSNPEKGRGIVSIGGGLLAKIGQEESSAYVRAVASGDRRHASVAGEAMQGADDESVALLMKQLIDEIPTRKKAHNIPTVLVRRATVADRAALAAALVTAGRGADAIKVRQWDHWLPAYNNLGSKELQALLKRKGVAGDAREAILAIRVRSHGTRAARKTPDQPSSFDLNLAILAQVMEDNGGTVPTTKSGKIGSWAGSRRKERKKGTLAPDRIAALAKIPGWWWTK